MQFDFQLFLDASPAVQIHVVFALFALFSGAFVFFRRKGTYFHRQLGKYWVGSMAIVALSSFFINQLKMWGPFSAIHLLSIFTLWSLVFAIVKVRQGDIETHSRALTGLYCGGLIFAGLLAFSRDLLLHRIFFGDGGGFIPSPQEWPGGPVVFALGGALAIFLVVLVSRNRDLRKLR